MSDFTQRDVVKEGAEASDERIRVPGANIARQAFQGSNPDAEDATRRSSSASWLATALSWEHESLANTLATFGPVAIASL
jgi:hypothetical protein